MPKVTGISIGSAEVRVVEVEGTSRRFKVLQAFVSPLDTVEEGPPGPSHDAAVQEVGRTLNQLLKDRRVSRDHVALVLPGRDCLVRNVQVPLKGEEAIRKVLKFEAEGFFQSADIDQLVVDFIPIRETQEGTEILVAAAPKASLRELLEKARLGGVDPVHVELDAVALFRCAQAIGMVDPEGDQILLDLGLHSCRLLVARAGKLAGLRSLRFGVAGFGLGPPAPPPETEQDQQPEGQQPEGQPPEQGGVGGAEGFARRLAREVSRFLAGFGPGFKGGGVLVCGPGAGLYDVREELTKGLGLQVTLLNPLARAEHGLSDKEAARIGPSLVPSMGVALELLGVAASGMDFRQEEFTFARRFERIRFPLAVALMLLAFLLVLQYSRLSRERGIYEQYYGTPADPPSKALLVPQIWRRFIAPLALPEGLVRTLRSDIRDPLERIPYWRTQLSLFKQKEETRLGYFPDLPPLESGLHVLRSFAWHIEQLRQSLSGKVLVTSMDLRVDATGRIRGLTFDLIFWGEGRRADFDELRRFFGEICKDPESPFAAFEPAAAERATNPAGGSRRDGNKLVLKSEIPIVEKWPPAGA